MINAGWSAHVPVVTFIYTNWNFQVEVQMLLFIYLHTELKYRAQPLQSSACDETLIKHAHMLFGSTVQWNVAAPAEVYVSSRVFAHGLHVRIELTFEEIEALKGIWISGKQEFYVLINSRHLDLNLVKI